MNSDGLDSSSSQHVGIDKTIKKCKRKVISNKFHNFRIKKTLKESLHSQSAEDQQIIQIEKSYPLFLDESDDKHKQQQSITHPLNEQEHLLQEKIEKEEPISSNMKLFVQINQDKHLSEDFKQNKTKIFEELQKHQYSLGQYITSGGQGDIYNGFREGEIQQDLIFKLYFKFTREEIDEEIRIMKSFEQHINIVQYKDSIISDKFIILVLEKCKYSLLDELKMFSSNQKQFTQLKLLQMIFDLLDGLIQLRIYNILHLDIKPSNILINSEDQYVYTDFGGSAIIHKDGQYEKTSVVYTPSFAADEIINNHEQIHFKSDVYSLGKTFEIILQFFEKQNTDLEMGETLEKFREIIHEKMIQNKILDRQECQKLHEIFFELIKKVEYSVFLKNYKQKIMNIINLYQYDNNKDITYFQEVKLYYLNIYLSIIQLANEREFDLFEVEQDIAITYFYLGNFDIALNKMLEQYYKLPQQFKDEQKSKYGLLLLRMGECFFNKQEPSQALKFAQDSHEIFQQLYSNNNVGSAKSLSLMGKIHLQSNDYEKSLALFLQSLEINKQLYGNENELVALCLNDIGGCYNSLGKYSEALQYFNKSNDMNRQLYQGNHPLTATTLNNIGDCLVNQGDYEKGIQFLKDSLEMKRSVLKENHPSIALSLMNIGQVYTELGQYKKSLEYLREAYQIGKQIFDVNNQTFSSIISNLGKCYFQMGDIENSLKYALKSFEINKQIFESGIHSKIANSLNDIGLCYNAQGDYQTALKYLIDSMEMKKQLYNANHPEIIISLLNIAKCYQQMDDFQNSKKFAENALKICREIFLGDHPKFVSSMTQIGEVLFFQGEYKSALKIMQEALDMGQRLYKAAHPIFLSILTIIGGCYMKTGDNEICLRYQLETLEIAQSIYPSEHIQTAIINSNIGTSLSKKGEYEKSLKYYLESNKILQKIYNKSHPHVIQSLESIGECYTLMKDNETAIKYFIEASKMIKEFYMEVHPDYSEMLTKIGHTYLLGDKYIEGLPYFKESLTINKQIFREDHPRILDNLNKICVCLTRSGQYIETLGYLKEWFKLKMINGFLDIQYIMVIISFYEFIFEKLQQFDDPETKEKLSEIKQIINS